MLQNTSSCVARACLCLALTLASAGPVGAQSLPADQWFKNPLLQGAQLSPDGEHVAAVYSDGDKQIVVVRKATGGEIVPLAVMQHEELRYIWLHWANDQRIFVGLRARSPSVASRGVRSARTRLFGVDIDGGNPGMLGEKWPTAQAWDGVSAEQAWLPVQHQDRVLHYLPDDPKHVVIEFRPVTEEFPMVKRMNVANGKLKTLKRPENGIHGYSTDHDGAVRYGWGQGKQSKLSHFLRTSAKGEWHHVPDERATFAGFSSDPKRAYVWRQVEGRRALFEWDIEARAPVQRIWSNPQYDGQALEFDPLRKKLVGVRYVAERLRIDHLDEERAALHRLVESRFPDTAVEFVSWSQNGKRAIAEVSGPRQAPRFLLLRRDVSPVAVDPLFSSHPWIDEVALGRSREFRFSARDGLEIPAVLTIPPGAKAKQLPTLLLVHGGPFGVRDSLRFDQEAQFFATRGYAVFQINFRGSGGYGGAFEEAGHGEFGEAMQRDLSDGARWLIEKGVADPKRIGIYGGSYGGYAAMMGLIQDPELFRAGASYAGVMDLRQQENDQRHFLFGRYWEQNRVDLTRGSLRDQSPIVHVAKIRAPVLLAHGENDSVVQAWHSRRMAHALAAAGKDVEHLEFPNEIHGFLLEANRVRFYEALADFFEKHLLDAS